MLKSEDVHMEKLISLLATCQQFPISGSDVVLSICVAGAAAILWCVLMWKWIHNIEKREQARIELEHAN